MTYIVTLTLALLGRKLVPAKDVCTAYAQGYEQMYREALTTPNAHRPFAGGVVASNYAAAGFAVDVAEYGGLGEHRGYRYSDLTVLAMRSNLQEYSQALIASANERLSYVNGREVFDA